MAQIGRLNTNYLSFRNGLADWTVTAIQKDQDGFIWIGTEHGLQRFDGYKFLTFNTQPGNPNRISDHFVNAIHAVKENKLAVFYEQNLDFFDLIDPYDYEIKKITLSPKNGISGVVRKLRVDQHGNILAIASTQRNIRVFRYRFSTHSFELALQIKADNNGDLKNQWLDALQINNQEWLVVNNRQGVSLANAEGLIHQFPLDQFQLSELKDVNGLTWNTFLHRDRKKRVWLAFHNVPFVFQYDSTRQQFTSLKDLPAKGEYTNLWEDKTGNVLFSRTNGRGYYPISEDIFCYTAKNQLKNFNNLLRVSPIILALYSDDFFNTIFLGIDTGIKIFRNNQLVVNNYLGMDIRDDEFGRVMRGITSDGKGHVFFAAENTNWYVLNRNTQKMDTIFLKDESTSLPINFSCCFDLHYDPKGYLWGIACQGRGKGLLIRYDLKSRMAKVYNYAAAFRDFAQTADGKFWLLSEFNNEENVLLSFDPQNGTFETFLTKDNRNPFQQMPLNCIINSKKGGLWIGTSKGIFWVDQKNKTARAIRSTPYLDRQIVYALFEDQDETLWVGTTFGLVQYNPKKEKVKYYGVDQGLASSVVSGILKDHLNNLWISTHDGLSCLDLSTGRITNFYDLDGFSHNSFTRYSFFRDNDNKLYFGTVNGVNAFRPEFLLQKESVPRIRLTSISKYDRRLGKVVVSNKKLRDLRTIVIKPWESNINIEFTLPVYTDPESNHYFAKLHPDNDQWMPLGNEHHLMYAKLTPGKHRLLIRGNDPRGNHSNSDLELEIITEQHFYNTQVFFGLLILLLGGLIYAGMRYRLMQQLKMERIRTQLASNIHDEVSGLLAGIALQSDVLQWDIVEPSIIEKLQVVAEVSRKAMSKLHDVIWSADARRDHVEDLLIRMQEHANDVLTPLNITYEIKAFNLNRQALIPVQIRPDLYFVFKEAINNVAKHVKEGKVEVNLKNVGNFFIMDIKDNGVIPPKETPSSGQGLKNMEMRAKRIKATLTTSWDDGFQVTLKMKRLG
jgi:ligand-binding sensor domain-containing protein